MWALQSPLKLEWMFYEQKIRRQSLLPESLQSKVCQVCPSVKGMRQGSQNDLYRSYPALLCDSLSLSERWKPLITLFTRGGNVLPMIPFSQWLPFHGHSEMTIYSFGGFIQRRCDKRDLFLSGLPEGHTCLYRMSQRCKSPYCIEIIRR